MKATFFLEDNGYFVPTSKESTTGLNDALYENDLLEIDDNFVIRYSPSDYKYVNDGNLLVIDTDNIKDIIIYREEDSDGTVVYVISNKLGNDDTTLIPEEGAVVYQAEPNAISRKEAADSMYGTDGDTGLAEDWNVEKDFKDVLQINDIELEFAYKVAVDPDGDTIYLENKEDYLFFLNMFKRSNFFVEELESEYAIYLEDKTVEYQNGVLIIKSL